jgi:acyl carrier protein
MVSIEDRVKTLLIAQLKIKEVDFSLELSVGDIPEWDSAAHVNLIMAVEEAFGLDLDIADTIEIEDVFDIIATLKRYDVK